MLQKQKNTGIMENNKNIPIKWKESLPTFMKLINEEILTRSRADGGGDGGGGVGGLGKKLQINKHSTPCIKHQRVCSLGSFTKCFFFLFT